MNEKGSLFVFVKRNEPGNQNKVAKKKIGLVAIGFVEVVSGQACRFSNQLFVVG